uniref:Uncharacterized protein TCIL3000_8_5220 n=1 Tax=Trypanosoma congolense (strain IL3000) TaxID=1068625 RepID=G0USD7_TRYCI|nr:unnamed protein product [Trypanosoma congolense IL3000]
MGNIGSSSVNQLNDPSGGQKALITSADRVHLELKLQRDNLVAAIRKYEHAAQSEHIKAIQYVKEGKRHLALYCLKRRKAQTSQITLVTDMLDNVQRLLDTVEFSQIEREVFDAMKCGKDELSRLNALLKADDVMELMDSTAETVNESRQINEILAQQLDHCDENLLLSELFQDAAVVEESKDILKDAVVPSHNLPSDEKTSKRATDSNYESVALSA